MHGTIGFYKADGIMFTLTVSVVANQDFTVFTFKKRKEIMNSTRVKYTRLKEEKQRLK